MGGLSLYLQLIVHACNRASDQEPSRQSLDVYLAVLNLIFIETEYVSVTARSGIIVTHIGRENAKLSHLHIWQTNDTHILFMGYFWLSEMCHYWLPNLPGTLQPKTKPHKLGLRTKQQ